MSKITRSKALANARAFLWKEKKTIEAIINLCQLNNDPSDWTAWYDEYGNKLKIYKSKSVGIFQAKNITDNNTDIFQKSKPDHIAFHSSWAMLMHSREVSVLWTVGKDERLRSSFFVEGCWKYNFPSLLSGLDALKLIASNYKKKEYQKLKINKCIHVNNVEINITRLESFGLPLNLSFI